MPVSMTALCDDLAAESAELRAVLAGLSESDWRRETPAEGWTVLDQVSHLAYFDDVALRSATDPDAFTAEKAAMDAEGGVSPDTIAARFRSMSGAEMLAWFDEARTRLIDGFRDLDPKTRVPWFGPPMAVASSLTARIMETWAHGQDVFDTVGAVHPPSERLRHVAHIGVGARAFSYLAHGLEMPDVPIRVELTAPDGSSWTWGPGDAADRISGPAEDFALLITQRRHRDDLALEVVGDAATEWVRIGQAFAGEPGTGRKPR
ncbi:TIGR03084 family metal-binding protein [Actinomycetospora termitidis]|uniref:TIGR03084 family metal-binding protein n=1 Tax=Actinomycetospora termitidis TaxID=3053470 RepID=A0ABT7MLC8_9PSEU|nr:TIGR03084 family metal-binding protein [Actinomycetospora sp. Odt1-22]MDL5160153.1 TIGR03084 family metal-binding protein [Actinomycetospora sp. Odt1-22]